MTRRACSVRVRPVQSGAVFRWGVRIIGKMEEKTERQRFEVEKAVQSVLLQP